MSAEDEAGAADRAGGLAALIARSSQGGAKPPVERWQPPFCGDIDMRIDRNGQWFYMGSPIGREAMVRLFASVLRREADRYFLVTPVEKVGITVEDVPFLAVEMHCEGADALQRLTFRTNVGDVVTDPGTDAVRFELAADGGLMPYVHVRAGLWARASRAVAHELAGLFDEVDGRIGLWSGGQFHPVPDAALE
ncbi:DUF1285 domain-containing protein [Oryzibacter oryziterrae]|uniref:DUF1285 domain-containing protein n=1 Tax=Oryzibacter oryziterrae TaxID=2766474 RepID=UPI001F3D2491|nr:DUF1285 domain-containing protein [Oryzibacter oryziterrae]